MERELNLSQWMAINAVISDESIAHTRLSSCRTYAEVRPIDIWHIDQAMQAADRAESQLGLTAVVVDPEIYDATN